MEDYHDSLVNNVRIMAGGHVEIDADKKLLAFSQGGPLNLLAQSLQPGDKIRWSGLAEPSACYHLEKLKLIRGERNYRRPKCECGTRYKSKGSNQKLKCPRCGSMADQLWEFDVIQSEWVEPPASYRRHLSKPINRICKSEG